MIEVSNFRQSFYDLYGVMLDDLSDDEIKFILWELGKLFKRWNVNSKYNPVLIHEVTFTYFYESLINRKLD